ncbi:MAG: LPS export ABC transporter periplasmic protein LptC [Bacteroidia bacterium]|nr:LPS export ABC transporter periplasmic protein LptC [Bacteroidia bacterium]
MGIGGRISIICLFAAMGMACRSPQKNIQRSPEWIAQRQAISPYEARGYTLEWMDSTGERIYVSAKQVMRVKSGDTAHWVLRGDVYALHMNGRKETLETLHSELARAYPEQEVYVAERNVVLHTSDPLRLETDYLRWEQGKNLMRAEGWVRLETPKEVLRGEGLEYNVKERTYRLRRMRGTIQSPVQ